MLTAFSTKTRFMASSVDTWSRRDGKFDLQRFYDNIVALFGRDGLGDRWADEQLMWMKKCDRPMNPTDELTICYLVRYQDYATMKALIKVTNPILRIPATIWE